MKSNVIVAIFAFFLALLAGCGPKEPVLDAVSALVAERPLPDFTIRDSSLIQTQPSGLKIYTVRKGPGARPEEGSILRLHYRAKALGGAEFDNTWTRKEPFVCIIGRSNLIPGMDEAVRKLNMGTQAVVIIPPALGYPEKETPPNIPPNSTLIYEVEILGNI